MRVMIPIDIQQGFADHAYWGGPRNNPDFETNVARLLAASRSSGTPVIHVKHDSVTPGSPLRPEAPGNALMAVAEPVAGEPVLGKTVNSGFIGTDLESRLRDMGATQVVAFGMTTDHCVSTTVRMAANLGFETILVADACATFPKRTPTGDVIDADTVHAVHLASLSGEFARVLTTRDLIALVNEDGS